MARTFAQISVSIWGDDDYMDLSLPAQWLYEYLISQPELSYCGVTDWRPKRITPKAKGLTVELIESAAVELVEGLYIITDDDTEEVLVRSFMRNDGLLKQKNMGVAVAKAHASVSSRTLRGIVVHELHRLKQENPSWTSWDGLKDVLPKQAINPSELLSGNPSGNPSINPFTNPSEPPTDDPFGGDAESLTGWGLPTHR